MHYSTNVRKCQVPAQWPHLDTRNDRLAQHLPMVLVGAHTVRPRAINDRPYKRYRTYRKNDTGQGKAKTICRSLGAKWERRLAAKQSLFFPFIPTPGFTVVLVLLLYLYLILYLILYLYLFLFLPLAFCLLFVYFQFA